MKITQTQVTIGLGIVGLGVLYFVGSKAAKAAQEAAGSITGGLASAGTYAAQALTPWSDQNIAYKAAGGIVSSLTGGREETLGGWLAALTGADGDEIGRNINKPIAKPNGLSGAPLSKGDGLAAQLISNNQSLDFTLTPTRSIL